VEHQQFAMQIGERSERPHNPSSFEVWQGIDPDGAIRIKVVGELDLADAEVRALT
jgi:hypothetical protein